MKTNILLTIFLLIILALGANAQGGYNWPEDDKPTAQTKWVLFNDNVKNKAYDDAKMPLKYLLAKCPDLNKLLYSRAYTMYNELARTATDAQLRVTYQDSALLMYDEKMRIFPDTKKDTYNRKGYYYYYYKVHLPAELPKLYAFYKEVLELNGTDTYPLNVWHLMDVACKLKTAKPEAVTDDEIIDLYEKVSEITEKAIAENKQADQWQQYKAKIDGLITTCVTMDCDFVLNTLQPKWRENPEDMRLTKKIFSLMVSNKCTEEPLYEEVLNAIFEKEPNHAMAKAMGRIAKNKGENDKAIEYFEKAIELTDEASVKADVAMMIASIYSKMGSKPSARTWAQKAVGFDNSRSDAYEFIGDLYFSTSCGGSHPVKSRLGYIAAYEQYRMAGKSSKMSAAKAQFPSKTDIFTYGMKIGEKMKTDCWIGETVELQARP